MAKLELKGLTIKELNAELEQTQEQYYSLKFNNAAGTLENTAEIKVVRRSIARINTELGARDLAESSRKRDKIQARRRLAKKIKK